MWKLNLGVCLSVMSQSYMYLLYLLLLSDTSMTSQTRVRETSKNKNFDCSIIITAPQIPTFPVKYTC